VIRGIGGDDRMNGCAMASANGNFKKSFSVLFSKNLLEPSFIQLRLLDMILKTWQPSFSWMNNR
jgi:hypothetical protein